MYPVNGPLCQHIIESGHSKHRHISKGKLKKKVNRSYFTDTGENA